MEVDAPPLQFSKPPTLHSVFLCLVVLLTDKEALELFANHESTTGEDNGGIVKGREIRNGLIRGEKTR